MKLSSGYVTRQLYFSSQPITPVLHRIQFPEVARGQRPLSLSPRAGSEKRKMAAAAAQKGNKKKAQRLPGGKAPCKLIQPKEKKPELRQSKQDQKTPTVRPGNKRKEMGEASGLPAPTTSRAPHQRKARLPAKASGKAAPSTRSGAARQASSKAKRTKVGRNLCFFSSKDLQYEVNELMRKELTARMFSSNPRGHH